MADYEQMEFDMTLDSERDLKANIEVTLSFACKQLQKRNLAPIKNRQEGYGVAAEYFSSLQVAQKKVAEGMKSFLLILPGDDSGAVSAASDLYGALSEVVLHATQMAAQMDRIMNDLYYCGTSKTPIEECIDAADKDDGFEEAETAENEAEDMQDKSENSEEKGE